MVRRFSWAFSILALALSAPYGSAETQGRHRFIAAPAGDDNGACTQDRPCSPQGAVNACPMGAVCNITLQPGIYPDPAMNIHYHRTISIGGDCSNPQAVIFRATTPHTALIWIQDHATAIVGCLALESETTGTTGIAGRQHIIADYEKMIFGPMPGGTHVAMNEFSIASCIGQNWIVGDAHVHIGASNHSKINLGCNITLAEQRAFSYFANASGYSIIDAHHALFGSEATGIGCIAWNAIVSKPAQGFPGSEPGNC
jgi:hypothetical protein